MAMLDPNFIKGWHASLKNQSLKETRDFLEAMAELKSNELGQTIFYELELVDSKTAALLSHVSIMMAVLSVFYAAMSNDQALRPVILIELFLYLSLTLGCLRSIFMFGPTETSYELENMLEWRIRAVNARVRFYKISLSLAIIITVAFMVTLFWHLISFLM